MNVPPLARGRAACQAPDDAGHNMPTYPIAASTKGLCKRTCSIALFSGTEIELGALFAVPLCRKPVHYPTGQPTADSRQPTVSLCRTKFSQILFPGPRRLVKYSVASPKVHIHPIKIYSQIFGATAPISTRDAISGTANKDPIKNGSEPGLSGNIPTIMTFNSEW
jgi:hypothetical protein